MATGGDDSKVVVIDRGTKSVSLQCVEGREAVLALAYNPSGGGVAAGNVDGSVLSHAASSAGCPSTLIRPATVGAGLLSLASP